MPERSTNPEQTPTNLEVALLQRAASIVISGPGWHAEVAATPRAGERAQGGPTSTGLSGAPPAVGSSVGLSGEIVTAEYAARGLDAGGIDAVLVGVRATVSWVEAHTLGRTIRWDSADGQNSETTLVLARDGDRYRCAGGSIRLDAQDAAELFELVGVSPPSDAGEVEFHAGGISLGGSRSVPWQPDAELAGSFLLTPTDDGAAHLAPEMDRLSPIQSDQWRESWNAFTTRLSPGSPQAGGSPGVGPSWLTLEAAHPGHVPALAWRLTGDEAYFELEPGALRVLVTDASPYGSDVQSVLVLRPASVSIVAGEPADGGSRRLEVTVHGPEPSIGDRSVGHADEPAAPTASGLVPQVVVTATRTGEGWDESAQLTDGRLQLDTLDLARRIRRTGGPSQPDGERPGAKPLRASVALDNGWLTLPIPDVTDQDLIMAGISIRGGAETTRSEPNDPVRSPAGSTGAVVYGSDRARREGTHPWSVAIASASSFDGTWTIVDGILDAATVRLVDPSITADGLIWVATDEARGRTDAPVGLPAGDNWTAGVDAEALYGGAARDRRAPSPYRFDTRLHISRSSGRAVLSSSVIEIGADPDAHAVFAASTLAGLEDFTTRHRPQAWVRHPRQPVVQGLSMTEPMGSPVEASANRSLLPFEPPGPTGTIRMEMNGTIRWPRIDIASLEPAPAWVESGIGAHVLSAPGVVLHPSATGHRVEFRYDIPFLDERAAFAGMPDSATSSRITASVSTGLDDYLTRLQSRAELAALEGVRLCSLDVAASVFDTAVHAGATGLYGLHGTAPLAGSIDYDASAYPAKVVIGLDGAVSEGRGDAVLDVPSFADGVSPALPSAVVAGSAGLSRNGVFRDQLGRARGLAMSDGVLVSTPLTTSAGGPSGELLTTVAPLGLSATGGETWQLWFQGLPCVNDGPNSTFDRLADRAEDGSNVGAGQDNDLIAAHDGYQWRLSPAPSLCGLDFSPLRLDRVVVAAGSVTEVHLVGRLHLPVGHDPESMDGLANTVRATFRDQGSGMELVAVSALGGAEGTRPQDHTDGMWPLQLVDGEVGGAPALHWSTVSFDPEAEELTVAGGDDAPHLAFFAFDRLWATGLDGPLVFPDVLHAGPITVTLAGPQNDLAADSFAPSVAPGVSGIAGEDVRADGAPAPAHLSLSLAADGAHDAELAVDFHAGEEIHTRVLVDLMRPELTARVARLEVFGAELSHTDTVAITSTSLQLAWTGRPPAGSDDAAPLEVLPGIPLVDPGMPGYAAFTFSMTASPSGAPEFHIDHGIAEVVMHGFRPDQDPMQLCSGAIELGYLARRTPSGAVWERTVTLNGWIRALGHQSLPVGDTSLDRPGWVTVNPIGAPQSWLRHTSRLLFDDHRIQLAGLEPGGAGLASSGTARGAGRSLWTLRGLVDLWAVVEHELAIVSADGSVASRRSFVVTQTCALGAAGALADAFDARATAAGPEGWDLGGFLHGDALGEVTAALRSNPEITVLSLDLAAWVRSAGVDLPSATVVRRLATGTTRAVAAEPTDYMGAGDWSLIRLPFLGVVGSFDLDGPLRTHPVHLVTPNGQDPLHADWAATMTGRPRRSAEIVATSAADSWSSNRLDDGALDIELTSEDALHHPAHSGEITSVVVSDRRGPGGRGSGPRLSARLRAPATAWLAQARAPGESEPDDAVMSFGFGSAPDGDPPKFDNDGSSKARLTIMAARDANVPGWAWNGEALEVTDGRMTAHAVLPQIRQNDPIDEFTATLTVTPTSSGRAMTIANEPRGQYDVLVLVDVDVDAQTATVEAAGGSATVPIPGDGLPATITIVISRGTERQAPGYELVVHVNGAVAGSSRCGRMRWRRGRTTRIRVGAPNPVETMRGSYHHLALFDRALTPGETSGARGRTTLVQRAVETSSELLAALFEAAPDATAPSIVQSRVHPAMAVTSTVDAFVAADGDAGRAAAARAVAGPFLALDLVELESASGRVEAESVELLALGRSGASETVRPIESRLHDDPLTQGSASDRTEADGIGTVEVPSWAGRALQLRAPNSGIAILRRRQVIDAGDGQVGIRYAFSAIPPPITATRVGWKGHALRSDPFNRIRRDVHFSGFSIPTGGLTVDLRPPLISAVQPIREPEFSTSGLAVTTRYSEAGARLPAGDGGREPDGRDARWHALQHRVRFDQSDTPAGFTADPGARDHHLAVSPAAPVFDDSDRRGGWHPVLPAAIRHVLTGTRAGALVDFDAQLLRGTTSGTMETTGSLVMTHRVPRPLPLPEPSRPSSAVPEDEGSVWVTSNPCDLARYDHPDGQAVYELQLLAKWRRTPDGSPAEPLVQYATVVADTDGLAELQFLATVHGPIDMPGSPSQMTLRAGSNQLSLQLQSDADTLSPGWSTVITATAPGSALADFFRAVPHGSLVAIDAIYAPPDGLAGQRRLDLQVRVAGRSDFPLVLRPQFLRFEDPDYNAALATEAASARGRIRDDEYVVAADRGSYAVSSPLVLGVRGPAPRPEATAPMPQLHVSRLRADGTTQDLGVLVTGSDGLWVGSLADLSRSSGAAWQTGDRLLASVFVGQPIATLTLPIVEADQTPAPTSAYALLRRDPDVVFSDAGQSPGVACVRYAMSPRADSIEFVNPSDVFNGIVRRRAVFRWLDTVRAYHRDVHYAVQKINVRGSTHVPELQEFVAERLDA